MDKQTNTQWNKKEKKSENNFQRESKQDANM